MSTECYLDVQTYLIKDGLPDTLNLEQYSVGSNGLERQLLAAFKNSKLYLTIVSRSSFSNQKYSILLKRYTLEPSPGNSFLDTNLLAFYNTPIKSIFTGTVSVDSVVFDNIERKYLYAIPVDSFQKISMDIDCDDRTYSNLFFYFAVLSISEDSVLIVDSADNDWLNKWTYWREYTDSLYISVGVDYLLMDSFGQLCKRYGILKNNLPQITIHVTKNSFPPVKKDPFYDDTSAMIFLEQDMLYQLSLYDELSDTFYYTVNPDSLYLLTITSVDSLPLQANLAPASSDFNQLDISGKKELVFRPVESSTAFCVEIKSKIAFPTNYTMNLGRYKGNDTADLFEPDDDVKTASVLYPDSTDAHTIFPQNDVDVYKVNCMGNDTFCISIDFGDSTILNAHNNFKVSSYYCFTQPEMKIHQLYCVDSVSIRRYTFYREVADTAVLIAEDKEIVNYSIILTR